MNKSHSARSITVALQNECGAADSLTSSAVYTQKGSRMETSYLIAVPTPAPSGLDKALFKQANLLMRCGGKRPLVLQLQSRTACHFPGRVQKMRCGICQINASTTTAVAGSRKQLRSSHSLSLHTVPGSWRWLRLAELIALMVRLTRSPAMDAHAKEVCLPALRAGSQFCAWPVNLGFCFLFPSLLPGRGSWCNCQDQFAGAHL